MKSYISRKLPVATRMTALILLFRSVASAMSAFLRVSKLIPQFCQFFPHRLRRQWQIHGLPRHFLLTLGAEHVAEQLTHDGPGPLPVHQQVDRARQRIAAVGDAFARERHVAAPAL